MERGAQSPAPGYDGAMTDSEASTPAGPETAPEAEKATLRGIFSLFFKIGIFSFGGGVLGWLFREAVEKRRWITDADFLGGLTLAQVMPGINVTNMAVYIGQRLKGAVGAVVAVVAVFSGPFFFVIGLFMVYARVKEVSWAPDFLSGVAAAAVGLFLSVGVKSIRKNIVTISQWLVMGAVFFAVGILRWPLVYVVAVMAPISVGLAWFALAREEKTRVEDKADA
jgi:chromate transporter